jgi:pilus assembly protein CpaB
MNLKKLAPLGAAVVLGLVAAIVASKSLQKPEGPSTPTAKTTIVTLKRDLSAGAEIRLEDVTASDLSSPVVPPGTFSNVADVIGRVTISPMSLGQPVLEPLLAKKGAVGGLQALVPTGMRAITIDVSETTGVGGLIAPGCIVDVLMTLNGDPAGPVTKTLVEAVKIQAVGQRMGPAQKDAPPEIFRSATLLVTPAEAEMIELASSTGRPRLVLRTNSDLSDSNTSGVSLAELRGTRRENEDDQVVQVEHVTPATQPVTEPVANVEPVREIPRRRTVKMIKGGVESTVTFESRRSRSTATVTDTSDMFETN